MKIKNNKKIGSLAIAEIFLLVASIVAFSYILGNSIPSVSAQTGEMCLADKSGNFVRDAAGNPVRVGQWTQSQINQWCNQEGRRSYACGGGSDAWILGRRFCPPETEQTTEGTDKTPLPIQAVEETAKQEVMRKFYEKFLKDPSDLTDEETNKLVEYYSDKDPEIAKKIKEGIELTSEDREKIEEEIIKAPSFFQKYLFSKDHASEAFTTGTVVAVIAVVYKFLSVGITTGDWDRALESAARVGIGAGVGLGAYTGLVALGAFGPAGWIAGTFVMAGVWASQFLVREQDRSIEFLCKPWQSQAGGENCDLCNHGLFPCTEYQCRSLGSGCKLINKDTSNPRCVWEDPRDVDPPEIIPWRNVLEEGYKYDPLPRGQFGVEIKYRNEECLPAFQPFTFGIELFDKEEKPIGGYCRIDFESKVSFDEMDFDFGGRNLWLTQHSHIMSFPGVVHIQDYLDKLELEGEAVSEIKNDGEYELYVRCMSERSGKANREEFLFKFCIDKGPDTTPPIIRGFNPQDGFPIAYFSEDEAREISVQTYTNKPAQCRWDWEDKDYANMENSMICSDGSLNYNSQLSYACSGTLTGLENRIENKFYFRCNDTFGNVNKESKTLTLIGTQPLIIEEASPNNTLIKSGTSPIKVTIKATTSAGFNRGEAECSYSRTGESGTFVRFSTTDTHKHETNIWLEPGNYDYHIICRDFANNADTTQIIFVVETDTTPPVVVRAFKEGNNLKIITDEKATCVYSDFGCNYEFEQGVKMISDRDGKSHTTEWNPNRNRYIKCKDEFENQPVPQNACSIIIRPFDIA